MAVGANQRKDSKRNDIGTGTVSAIMKEARQQIEYLDIDCLDRYPQIESRCARTGSLGFAIRHKKIMEENGVREDQLESLILDFTTYCFRHNIAFDKVFESGYEALNLAINLASR